MEISSLLEGGGLWKYGSRACLNSFYAQYLDTSSFEKENVLEAHLNESSDDGE